MIIDDILNYRFLVPIDEDTENFFKKTFIDSYFISDGSPFCSIDKGALIRKEKLKELPSTLSYTIYKITNFSDIDDFITAFVDGDCENDDFIK